MRDVILGGLNDAGPDREAEVAQRNVVVTGGRTIDFILVTQEAQAPFENEIHRTSLLSRAGFHAQVECTFPEGHERSIPIHCIRKIMFELLNVYWIYDRR